MFQMAVVMVVTTAVTCLPQEVPGLANMEILKIVPKRSSHTAHEPILPLTPTAADRRYDVMIDYDYYYDDDDGPDEVVATTLERPQTLLIAEHSDYVLRPFELNLHRQSNMRDAFVDETQAVPPETSLGDARLLLPLGFEEQDDRRRSGVSNDPFLPPVHSISTDSIPNVFENGQDTERFIPNARNKFVPPTEKQFISGTRERLLPYIDTHFVQDNTERFLHSTEKVQTASHFSTPTPDSLLSSPGRDTPPLVNEESIQHDTVVLAPPNALRVQQQGIEIRNFALHPPAHHNSRSAKVYLSDVQHSSQASLLSTSLRDSYESRRIGDKRSSRMLHHSEADPFHPHTSQQSSHNHYETAGKKYPKSSTLELSDTSHQRRALSSTIPSYVRRVESQPDMKRDRTLHERPPAGLMSREERAYYTGLQQEIEKSELLLDAIKDVRTREGKSIKTLKRRNDNHSLAITSPLPDIKEVKKKFGSHPLYQDLPREKPLAVKAAGPLLHRDEYSSERDEYEKMYLPVRAKSLELREIHKVKEHFHSLVPLKLKKKPHSTSRAHRESQTPPVTTYKPTVVSKYIKYHKHQSVTTAKPYNKVPASSYVKLQRKTIPTPPRYTNLASGRLTVHAPSGAVPTPLQSPQRLPTITNSRNTAAPSLRKSTAPQTHRSTETHQLFYHNTHKPQNPSSNTRRTHRASRLYRPQELPSIPYGGEPPHNSRAHRSFGNQHEDSSSHITSDPTRRSLVPSYTSNRQVTKPNGGVHDSAAIQSPTLEAKVRRKRGPEMEEFLNEKMKFPKFGYDIDPYFSGFPRFGFFDNGAVKKS